MLITKQSLIDEQPELVQKMVTASIKGWEKYLAEPVETNAYIHEQNEEMGLEILAYGVEAMKPLCVVKEEGGKHRAYDCRALEDSASTVDRCESDRAEYGGPDESVYDQFSEATRRKLTYSQLHTNSTILYDVAIQFTFASGRITHVATLRFTLRLPRHGVDRGTRRVLLIDPSLRSLCPNISNCRNWTGLTAGWVISGQRFWEFRDLRKNDEAVAITDKPLYYMKLRLIEKENSPSPISNPLEVITLAVGQDMSYLKIKNHQELTLLYQVVEGEAETDLLHGMLTTIITHERRSPVHAAISLKV